MCKFHLKCQTYITNSGCSINNNCYYLLFKNLAQNHKKRCCWEEECTYRTWQFFLLTQELLLFAPQFPAVSFCSIWCSIRKFPCRFLRRQPALRLWIFSWAGWEIVWVYFFPFMPRKTFCFLKHREESFSWLWDLD